MTKRRSALSNKHNSYTELVKENKMLSMENRELYRMAMQQRQKEGRDDIDVSEANARTKVAQDGMNEMAKILLRNLQAQADLIGEKHKLERRVKDLEGQLGVVNAANKVLKGQIITLKESGRV